MGRAWREGGEYGVGLSECLCQEIVFRGPVSMLFEIGSRHTLGWHLGFVVYMDRAAFLKKKLVEFGVDWY